MIALQFGQVWAVGGSGRSVWSLGWRILHFCVGVIAVGPSRCRERLLALMLLLRDVTANFFAVLRRLRLRWMSEIQKLPVNLWGLNGRRSLAT